MLTTGVFFLKHSTVSLIASPITLYFPKLFTSDEFFRIFKSFCIEDLWTYFISWKYVSNIWMYFWWFTVIFYTLAWVITRRNNFILITSASHGEQLYYIHAVIVGYHLTRTIYYLFVFCFLVKIPEMSEMHEIPKSCFSNNFSIFI